MPPTVRNRPSGVLVVAVVVVCPGWSGCARVCEEERHRAALTGAESQSDAWFSRLHQRGPSNIHSRGYVAILLCARSSAYASVLAVHPFSLLWAASMEQ